MYKEELLRALLEGTQRRIFVSYHHQNDQWYYDQLSTAFGSLYQVVQDRSLDRAVDSDNPDYVIRRIRENHITGSSCTLVLCGPETRWRKYVDWEIKATLDKEHGLIGVGLPTSLRDSMGRVSKPDRLQDNLDSGYAVWVEWANLTTSPDSFRGWIELANSRLPRLIVNTRSLRRRNGP